MASLNSHGLHPQEEAIMDAWDAGLSREDIALETGLSLPFVRKVIQNYADGGPNDLWAYRVPAASASLLQAIARAHPERVAA